MKTRAMMAVIAILSIGPGASSAPPRPKIVGIANVAFRVTSLDSARNFYGKVLGFQEAFTVQEAAGGPDLTCFKVNDRQYIEVSPIPQDPKSGKLLHIAFETTDARELRDYLASKDVAVPDKIEPGPDGNLSFTVSDPDGYSIEFVEYLPASVQSRSLGKLMPETRISGRIFHAGMLLKNRAAADHFYKDILGFRVLIEVNSGFVRNVAMLVPDGSDFVEYALTNSPNPPPMLLGVANHLCLDAVDIQAAYRTVLDRGYKPPREPARGQTGHWQLNLYDPDGSRTELMNRWQ